MNCRKRKKKISIYLDRELSQERAREVERHLAGCNVCQREFESLKRVSDYVRELFGAIEATELALDFEEKFYAQVEIQQVNSLRP